MIRNLGQNRIHDVLLQCEIVERKLVKAVPFPAEREMMRENKMVQAEIY